METLKKCSGCGAQIQSKDESLVGYLPKDIIDRTEIEANKIICKRCHRIKHYNEILKLDLDEENFTSIIKSIESKNTILLYIVDIFDLEGSWLSQIPEYLGNHRLFLVVNKIDLLPRDVKIGKLRLYMQNFLKKKGIKASKIYFLSANKKKDLGYLLEDLKSDKANKIYIIGSTNVGKSTLINALAPFLQDKSQTKLFDIPDLTSSLYSGTTVETLQIPISPKLTLFDTPGIIKKDRMIEFVCNKCLTKIIPKNQIKPKVYQLNSNQSLFIEGLARMDYLEGERQTFVCYFSNEIAVHRTKLTNADDFFEKHYKSLISPPCDACNPILDEWISYSYDIEADTETDIVISGLGWITVKGQATKLRIHCPKTINVSTRLALV